jgi:hypothetical protein
MLLAMVMSAPFLRQRELDVELFLSFEKIEKSKFSNSALYALSDKNAKLPIVEFRLFMSHAPCCMVQ